jgi:CheY-like chemotaxis protein
MPEETKIRVLVVDDDEAMLDAYEAGLAAGSYEIKTFASPKEAREFLFAAAPADIPHVILMDIMMPGIDGVSLTHEIHSWPGTAHIPIIAVSGLNDSATSNDALLFGAMEYVAKPFEFEVLETKIKKAYEISRQRAPKL